MDVNNAEAERLYERLRAKMDEHGWAVLTVASPDGHQPGFAYSVGLAKWGHAELVIYGLPADTAQAVINSVGRRIAHDEQFHPGDEIRGAFTDDIPLKVLAMSEAQSLTVAKAAHRFFDSPIFVVNVVQLVWPDVNGLWPWQTGCEAAARQPLATTQGELPFL